MEFCYGICYGILLWNFAMEFCYGISLWNFAMKIYGCLLWKFAMVACCGNLLQTAVRFWPYGALLAVPCQHLRRHYCYSSQLTHVISY